MTYILVFPSLMNYNVSMISYWLSDTGKHMPISNLHKFLLILLYNIFFLIIDSICYSQYKLMTFVLYISVKLSMNSTWFYSPHKRKTSQRLVSMEFNDFYFIWYSEPKNILYLEIADKKHNSILYVGIASSNISLPVWARLAFLLIQLVSI